MLYNFIQNLSYRFRSENDLSDVTWTMCETSKKFKSFFIRFFFSNLNNIETVILFREKSNEDSRPDFILETNQGIYLIENKINDKKHHFEQYIKTFNITADRLGYITNYPLLKAGFKIHTWREFYLYAKDHIPHEESDLWSSYLEYLKSVCDIFLTNKPMQLTGMFSLYSFYRSLDDVFVFDTDRFSSMVYNSKKDTNNGGNFLSTPRDGVMGKYFEIQFKKIGLTQTWGWMGVYFEREDPLICIGFCNRENWGRPIYNLLLKSKYDINGNFSKAPYEEDGAFWFEFSCSKQFDSLDLPNQIDLLRSFFEEVINIIYDIRSKQ